jgi:hypothetical protein
MQQRLVKLSLVALLAVTIAGCGNNTHNDRSLDTKSLYEVAANDKLVIHIENDKPGTGTNSTTADDKNSSTEETNQPPVAVVHANDGTDFISVHVGEPVFFSSEGSHDPDGQIAKYIWTDMDDNVLSTDANFTRTFYVPAIYEKTLTVTDDKNSSAYARVCILADITQSDINLIAHAGPDIYTKENTPVTINGRAICKTGDFSYEWKEGDEVLSESATLSRIFSVGRHKVYFKITDNSTGMYAVDTVIITVKPAEQVHGE